MNIVVDTHPWVWFLTANSRLSTKARLILSDPSNLIIIPSIIEPVAQIPLTEANGCDKIADNKNH